MGPLIVLTKRRLDESRAKIARAAVALGVDARTLAESCEIIERSQVKIAATNRVENYWPGTPRTGSRLLQFLFDVR